ncbi:hypothetical protein LINPERPRIM_LOCUS40921 [Linum perenne]
MVNRLLILPQPSSNPIHDPPSTNHEQTHLLNLFPNPTRIT